MHPLPYSITKTVLRAFLAAASISLLPSVSRAQAPAATPAAGEVNTVCPITGKPSDPGITVVYEGQTYAFADDASRTKWNEARANSLYQKLGGKAAINAVVEAFYVKVLADERINQYFKEINMTRQRKKQKEFLSAAFGGPIPWTGVDLRTAHRELHVTEADFKAVAGNLQKTLEELNVKQELIDQVMAIAGSVHDEVLNLKPAAK